jgi:hypothetical protein
VTVEEAEVEQHAEALDCLPEWRRPYGAVTAGVFERERNSLADAIVDALGAISLTRAQVAEVIAEDWGSCADELLDDVLDDLVDDRLLRRWGNQYARSARR